MAAPRVYADFHDLDDAHRVRLECSGTLRDLEAAGVRLRAGLALMLYADDADDDGRPGEIRAAGTVRRGESGWVAEVDWSAIRHASDGG